MDESLSVPTRMGICPAYNPGLPLNGKQLSLLIGLVTELCPSFIFVYNDGPRRKQIPRARRDATESPLPIRAEQGNPEALTIQQLHWTALINPNTIPLSGAFSTFYHIHQPSEACNLDR